MINPHGFSSHCPERPGVIARTPEGLTVPVMASSKGSFLAFDLTGPATLVLEREAGWKGAQVKPASAGARYLSDGPRLSIELAQARPLLVECPEGALVSILARPPVEEPPAPANNGRLLRFAAGQIHEVGCLELQDHDVVWLDPGAWVRGQIIASHAEGVIIGGRGVLENPPARGNEPRYRSIILDHCRNARISGIHMLTTHSWMITLGNCDGVVVEDISQEGNGRATDGIDVVGSRDVTIRGCFLLNGDDNIAVKAMNTRTQAGPPKAPTRNFDGDWTGEVRNLLVEHCAFYNDHGGSSMEIGYETRTERISGITFRDIDVMAVHQFGSVFGIHTGDRATIADILWEDVRVEHHFDMLIDFRILHSRWNRDTERGRVSGVTLRRIRVSTSEYNEGYTVSVIGGWDADHMIRNVSFDDFQIDGRRVLTEDDLCLYTRRVEGISIQ